MRQDDQPNAHATTSGYNDTRPYGTVTYCAVYKFTGDRITISTLAFELILLSIVSSAVSYPIRSDGVVPDKAYMAPLHNKVKRTVSVTTNVRNVSVPYGFTYYVQPYCVSYG